MNSPRPPSTTVRDRAPMVVDPTTQALITLEFDHHELHVGNLYTSQYSPLNVGSGATASIHFKSPSGTIHATGQIRKAHMIFGASCELGATIKVLEGPNVTVPGTPLTAINHNRDLQEAAPSQTQVFSQPTYNGGTLLVGDVIGTSGGGSVGGNTRSLAEFILKSGSSYVLEATNNGAQASDMVLTGVWYEHGFGYDDD